MKSKNKLLIFIIGIIAIIVTAIGTVSVAASTNTGGNGLDNIKKYGSDSVGFTIRFRFADLNVRDDLYCIQQGAHMSGENVYTVSRYVSIIGNTATYNNMQVNSTENGKLVYLLSKREGYGKVLHKETSAQLSLWHLINQWSNVVGSSFGFNVNYTGNDDSELLKNYADRWSEVVNYMSEAEKYANNVGNNEQNQKTQDRTDKSNIKTTTYTENNTSYVRVGPFKWSFNGTITKVNVYGNNDKEIPNIRFSKFEGNQEKTFNDCSQIKNGDNFYILIKADTNFTEIKKISAENIISTEELSSEIWFLESTEMQNLILVNPGKKDKTGTLQTTFEYNIPITKNLNIIKVDSRNSSIKLDGVGFKIQNKETGKYVRKQNGTITYVNQKSEATEFITDKNGRIEIKGLIVGTYLAQETKNPHYGYKVIDGNIEIPSSVTNKTIANEQVYIKLSGYVWKDIQSTKQTTRNDLYKTNSSNYVDDKDTAFNGIIVRLKDKNGKTVKETTTSERGLYSEINGGEYIFNDVLITELPNYYVEFEYDGLIWQSVAVNKNQNSGSKATDTEERKILDNNFSTVDATGENRVNVNNKYSITYNETKEHATSIKDSSACTLHANTKDAKYTLFDKFSSGKTTEIKYINLGLYEKPQADLSLSQDLQNVNVGVNGYWHIYKYAKRKFEDSGYDASNQSTWNVGVKFKNSYTGTYRRAIYKSDLEYENPNDRNKELQVYLTYKIAISNESSYITRANSIVDYFDNRYTLVKVGTGLDEQMNITGDVSYQTPQSYNDKYQKCIINVNTTVKSGESNYVYVQFKLERNAVVQIMNNGETLSNRAEVHSYTVFRDDKGNTVAAIDKDSVPGNTKIEDIETYEDDTDSAPAIQLELADPRKIEGTVFVDNTSGELKTGQIRQGNGIFDNGETAVKDVKVTLHEINNSIADMETTTGEDGNFEFSGYIPGQYTITYTWGDKTYTVQNYKGTVYDSSRKQDNMYWYKDDVETRKTDAIDNYDTRKIIDEETAKITNNTINNQIVDAYNGGNNHPEITKTSMDSTTPTMEFGVEYDSTITDGMGNKVEFIVKNVDFGIVERARQQLDMIKRVSSFKITLANGQVLVDATVDENGNLQGLRDYVTYMGPSVSNGISNKGYIKAEMDNELIEGATLEVGYEIKFINNSELDYMSERYYKYGIKEGNVVTLTPSAVVDYLDKNLGFDQNKNTDWKQITVDDLNTLHATKVEDIEFLNSRMILYTDKTAQPIEPTGTISVKLNVSKLLTTSEDLAFNNDAETVTINKPDVDDHKGSIIKYFPTDDAEEVIITQSTGDDRNYVLPVTVGIMALIVLGVGIFIIKKSVINKK